MSIASTDALTATSFWRRQFAGEVTTEQRGFDVTFGLIMPVLCLLFDPIVFSRTMRTPILASHFAAGSLSIACGLLALSYWLTTRRPSAVLAGILFGNALISLILGLVLLPFSVLGLFVIVGAFGFVPFLTAFVFWRNADRVYQRIQHSQNAHITLVLLGFSIACGVPIAADMYVANMTSRGIRLLLADDPEKAEQGLSTLQQVSVFIDTDALVTAYLEDRDENRRETLSRAYYKLTGESLSSRVSHLESF